MHNLQKIHVKNFKYYWHIISIIIITNQSVITASNCKRFLGHVGEGFRFLAIKIILSMHSLLNQNGVQPLGESMCASFENNDKNYFLELQFPSHITLASLKRNTMVQKSLFPE